jgi:hypothetical protein
MTRHDSSLKVWRAPDGRSASDWLDGMNTNFSGADSAAQEKCSDGRTTLYRDGE